MATTQVSTSVLKDGSVTSAKLDTNIAISGNLIVDTNTLYVDSTNNRVGIGTDSPVTALNVRGDLLVEDSTGTRFVRIDAPDAGNSFVGRIGTTSSHDLVLVSANTERMRITSGGNVGIGVSPSTELHVKGSAEIFRIDDSSSTGSPFMTFFQNGTRRSLIQHLDSGDLLSLVSEYGGVRFMTGTGGTEVERMRITSGGDISFRDTSANEAFYWDASTARLGIGTGSSPSAGIHVKSGSITTPSDYSSFLSNATAKIVSNHSSEYGISIGYANATTDTIGIQSGNTAASRPLSLQPYGGSVGIGTDSPAVKLAVYDSSTPKIHLQNASSGILSTDGLQLALSGTNGYFWNYENGNILFGTNATERLSITSAGAIHLSQGSGNAFVGTNAGNLGTSTGTNNSAFGESALTSNTTGGANTAVGRFSLNANTTGASNTANGYGTLYANTTGIRNTASGYSALFNNTTGGFNTATGYTALYSNTTASYNTANGYAALKDNTTGTYNTAIGLNSLQFNTTGYQNTANGYAALSANTTGYYNTAYGAPALFSNTTGVENTATGYGALGSNTTGNYNTANGAYALNANTTASQNTANGRQALYLNTTGANNTAYGSLALYSNTTGTQNTANGTYALYSNTTASNNTANGYSALYFNTTGTRNTASGYAALYQNTGGNYNTATGYTALENNTTGVSNTAYGYAALSANTTSSDSAGIGYAALLNSTGGQNTAIGNYTLSTTTTGVNNTGVGYNAQASSAIASNEVILGNSSVTTLICNTQTITALSDIRDKKDIKELQGAEAFIKELKPVSFVWNQRDGGRVDIDDNGFIAQDLIEAQEKSGHKIPNLVLENNPEKLQAAYGAMLPTIVSALQSALKEIDLLKTEIETLKNK